MRSINSLRAVQPVVRRVIRSMLVAHASEMAFLWSHGGQNRRPSETFTCLGISLAMDGAHPKGRWPGCLTVSVQEKSREQ
jgi:hypothetical protein